MMCPTCNTAAAIRATRTVAKHDDTPDETTEVYQVQEFACRNRRCPQYDKTVGEIEHQIL
jgi:hypothetical protein